MAEAVGSGFGGPPTALTRFVGRARELEAVTGLLGGTRLLTLTGAGGSGKTRLAAEAARRVGERWPVAAWIDLASLHDPAGLANHVAAGLGLAERDGESAVAAIRRAIGADPMLLVLDNCEHVVDACAGLTEVLLMDLGALTILATSREALGVQGETAWLVPPLSASEARELFVERARASLPSFALTRENAPVITEICRRLDGIPLAIELAAARVRLLSVDQIEERLRDALRLLSSGARTAVPRHRTLRGTIEWSYALLTGLEQVLFRRLAIFPAGFSLEAAEAIASGDGIDEADVLELLGGLADKSLVMLETTEADPRYRLLETVRQFAAERLAEAGEDATLARRHAEHFLAIAEIAAPHIFGGTIDRRWIEAHRRENHNFRAAVEWAGESPDRYPIGLRLAWALHWFWWARGHGEETLRLRAAFESDRPIDPLVLARGYMAYAHQANWQGRLDEAARFGAEGLALARRLGDRNLETFGLSLCGATSTLQGNFDEALVFIEEAVVLGRDHCDNVTPAIALHFRAVIAMDRGDFVSAMADHVEEEQVSRRLGHLSGITHGLTGQANVLYTQGRLAEALPRYAGSLEVAVRADDGWGIAKGVEGIAECIAGAEPDRAARLLAAAEAYRERIASPRFLDEAARAAPVLETLQRALGPRFAECVQAGRSTGLAEMVADALAAAPAATGQPVAAPVPVPMESFDLEVRLLGGFAVVRRGEVLDPAAWGSARTRELLAILLLHPGGVTKEQVGLWCWPEASPTQLRNNFHVTLHRLRKALGDPEWIGLVGERYQLAANLRIDVDARRLDEVLPTGTAALARGDGDAVPRLAAALAEYRGALLDGEPVGDWAVEFRDRLARNYSEAALALARWYLGRDRFDDAIGLARAVVARDPVSEAGWRALMVGLARSGRRPEALKTFQQCSAVLAADLDVDPDPETEELRDRIQRGDPV